MQKIIFIYFFLYPTSVKRNGFLSTSKKSEERKKKYKFVFFKKEKDVFLFYAFRRRPLPKERGAENTSMGDLSPIPPASFSKDKKGDIKRWTFLYFLGFAYISILYY